LDVVTGAARGAALRGVLVPGLARGGICHPLGFEPV
jgi:hypothetical protein